MQHQFTVTGMTCGHCERAVQQAIMQLDAAASVQIDRTQNRVQVASTQSRDALAKVIRDEGYVVEA